MLLGSVEAELLKSLDSSVFFSRGIWQQDRGFM
jgi:hypothetical protein